jgi:hypothetical protein
MDIGFEYLPPLLWQLDEVMHSLSIALVIGTSVALAIDGVLAI